MDFKIGNLTSIGRYLVASTLCVVGVVSAALPPQYQNERDLTVILDYIKANPDVLSGLQAIDLTAMSVYYGDGCSARFARKFVDQSEGLAGPAAPLEFVEASCPEVGEMLSEDDELGGITDRETSACSTEVKEEPCKL